MVNSSETLTSSQCRAARALLGWSQDGLADRAGVSRGTVKNLEAGQALSSLAAKAVRIALEREGVMLLGDGSSCDGNAVVVGVAIKK